MIEKLKYAYRLRKEFMDDSEKVVWVQVRIIAFVVR